VLIVWAYVPSFSVSVVRRRGQHEIDMHGLIREHDRSIVRALQDTAAMKRAETSSRDATVRLTMFIGGLGALRKICGAQDGFAHGLAHPVENSMSRVITVFRVPLNRRRLCRIRRWSAIAVVNLMNGMPAFFAFEELHDSIVPVASIRVGQLILRFPVVVTPSTTSRK
jgi:hypothetical protein